MLISYVCYEKQELLADYITKPKCPNIEILIIKVSECVLQKNTRLYQYILRAKSKKFKVWIFYLCACTKCTTLNVA